MATAAWRWIVRGLGGQRNAWRDEGRHALGNPIATGLKACMAAPEGAHAALTAPGNGSSNPAIQFDSHTRLSSPLLA